MSRIGFMKDPAGAAADTGKIDDRFTVQAAGAAQGGKRLTEKARAYAIGGRKALIAFTAAIGATVAVAGTAEEAKAQQGYYQPGYGYNQGPMQPGYQVQQPGYYQPGYQQPGYPMAPPPPLVTQLNQAPNPQACEGNAIRKFGLTVGGAAAGYALGSEIGGGTGKHIARVVGTLLGAGLGNSIAGSLDAADCAAAEQNVRMAALHAQQYQPVVWNNPSNGNSVIATPMRDGYTPSGMRCREIDTTIMLRGDPSSARTVTTNVCMDHYGNVQVSDAAPKAAPEAGRTMVGSIAPKVRRVVDPDEPSIG